MDKMLAFFVLCGLSSVLAAPLEGNSHRLLPPLDHEEVHDEFGQFALRYVTAEGTVVSERGRLIPALDGAGYVMMYFVGVLCLLWSVVALPTPEQLHTNVPAPPSLPELNPDEKDKNIIEDVLVDPIPPVIEDASSLDKEIKENFDRPKEEAELIDKPKEEEEKEKEEADKKEIEKENEEGKEVKDEDVVKVIEQSADPKEKPKEEEPKEDKKEEESKDEEVDEGPIIVQIFKPKPYLADLFSQFFPGFQFPHFSLPDFLRPKSSDPLELDEPVYIIKELDFK
ncbi:unnamed protein product [Spodoptera exigua]|nr:unnamed protein product [Spodoptera exigua]